jgi:uncharacterized protein with PIN domain
LDAFCLVEIFDYLKARSVELNFEFDYTQFLGRRLKRKVGLGSILAKRSTNTNEEEDNDDDDIEISNSSNEPRLRPKDLRVICDNMLGGLCKELRRCGVDSIVLDNDTDHSNVALIARRENRYALSCGIPYIVIKSQLVNGKCVCVRPGSAKDQCAQIIEHFNVDVRMNDLFSRCRLCNEGSFTKIDKQQFKALWHKHNRSPTNYKGSDYDLTKDENLINKINVNTLQLKDNPNVKVNLNEIFGSKIDKNEIYFICNGCGHVYWVN